MKRHGDEESLDGLLGMYRAGEEVLGRICARHQLLRIFGFLALEKIAFANPTWYALT